MRPISVIIPYRSDNGWRDRLFRFVLQRYQRLLPSNCEVVLGTESSLHEFFCRSEAINNGARSALHDLFLIADADAVFYPDALNLAELALSEGVSQWAIPYDRYLELNENTTHSVLANCPVDSDPCAWVSGRSCYDVYYHSNASLVLVTREAFEEVRGFDERFIGWGPEDQAWAAALTTLCGEPLRITIRDMIHLWHPIVGARGENPHFGESLLLWDRYKAATGNKTAMQGVLQQ